MKDCKFNVGDMVYHIQECSQRLIRVTEGQLSRTQISFNVDDIFQKRKVQAIGRVGVSCMISLEHTTHSLAVTCALSDVTSQLEEVIRAAALDAIRDFTDAFFRTHIAEMQHLDCLTESINPKKFQASGLWYGLQKYLTSDEHLNRVVKRILAEKKVSTEMLLFTSNEMEDKN